MSAMFLPRSRAVSVPAYFARFRSAASVSRKRHSAGVKSSSLRKLRLRRLNDIRSPRWFSCGSRGGGLDGVSLDRAGHAARASTATAELAARDGDDFDALLAQVGVGRDVALVAHDDAGLDGQEVVPVVPLLTLRSSDVLVGLEDRDLVDPEGLTDGGEQVVVADDLEPVRIVGAARRQDRPGPRGLVEVRIHDE